MPHQGRSERVHLPRQAAAAFARNEDRVVLRRQPADDGPSCYAIFRHEGRAGGPAQRKNVDPADMVGEQENVAAGRLTVERYPRADRARREPQKPGGPRRAPAGQAPAEMRDEA